MNAAAEPGLRKLADGIHAWIGTGGDSNAGAIETPDGLLVIDAQQHTGLAQQFRRSLEQQIGRPLRALVNTHYHFDHVAGNVLFADDVPILAHELTLQRLEHRFGPRVSAPWSVEDLPTKIAMFYGENIQDLIAPDDPAWSWFERRFAPTDYDRLVIAPPTETFADRFSFHMPDMTVTLDYFGPTHSHGDIIVHIPERKIAFLSDLFFFGRFPWLGDCDLSGWIDALDRILTYDLELIVPGHGIPGTLADVKWFRDLLFAMREAVGRAVLSGVSEEAAVEEVRLPEYAHLPRYEEWLRFNIRSAYRYLK